MAPWPGLFGTVTHEFSASPGQSRYIPRLQENTLGLAGQGLRPGAFKRGITMADHSCEFGPVRDLYDSASGCQHIGRLQRYQRIGDPGAADVERDRQKFVGQVNFVTAEAIAAHEQPPCEALLDGK